MVLGSFKGSEHQLPYVPTVLSWDKNVQTPSFVLDTGFSGEVAVTAQMAKDLGLIFDSVMTLNVASGAAEVFQTANVFATMEGQTYYMTAVLIPKGKRPLLGIKFMEKFRYKATVDCYNKTVRLDVA